MSHSIQNSGLLSNNQNFLLLGLGTTPWPRDACVAGCLPARRNRRSRTPSRYAAAYGISALGVLSSLLVATSKAIQKIGYSYFYPLANVRYGSSLVFRAGFLRECALWGGANAGTWLVSPSAAAGLRQCSLGPAHGSAQLRCGKEGGKLLVTKARERQASTLTT